MYARRHRPFDALAANAKHELNVMRHTRDVYVSCVLRALSNTRWLDATDECAAVLQLLRQDADTMTRIPRAYRTTTTTTRRGGDDDDSRASTPRQRLLRLLSSSAAAAAAVTTTTTADADAAASPSWLHSPRDHDTATMRGESIVVGDGGSGRHSNGNGSNADDTTAAAMRRRLSHMTRDTLYNDRYARALSERARSSSSATAGGAAAASYVTTVSPTPFRIPMHAPMPLSAQAAVDLRRIAVARAASGDAHHDSNGNAQTRAHDGGRKRRHDHDDDDDTTCAVADNGGAVVVVSRKSDSNGRDASALCAWRGRASISDPVASLRRHSLHRTRATSTLRALFSDSHGHSNNGNGNGEHSAATLSFLQPPATPARVTAQRRARAAAAVRARRLRAVRAAAAAMTHTPNLSRRMPRNFTPSCVGKYTQSSISLLYGDAATNQTPWLTAAFAAA